MDSLTLDAAVEQLTAQPETAPADEVVKDEAETAQTGEDQGEAQDDALETQDSEAVQAADDADTQDANVSESEEDNDTVQPSIEPPSSWNAEQKAIWANIPDDAKPALIAIEQKRNQDVANAFAKAAEREREAQAKLADPTLPDEIMSKVNQTLSIASAQFTNRWEGVTREHWLNLAQNNPAEYTQLKAMYDADKEALDELSSLQSQQALKAEQDYLNAEREKAKEIFPELANKDTQDFLATTLRGAGFDDSQIRMASARELKFVHDLATKAKKWDDSQSALKAPKTQAAPKTVKGSTKSPVNSQTKTLEALKKKAFASGKMDDMVAYEMARAAAS